MDKNVTAAALVGRQVECLDKIEKLAQQAESEDRDLTPEEQKAEADLWAEHDSLKARAERAEKLETERAGAMKSAGRASAAPAAAAGAEQVGGTVKAQLAARLQKRYGKIASNPPETEETIV